MSAPQSIFKLLPSEIQNMVAEHLDVPGLLALTRTCKHAAIEFSTMLWLKGGARPLFLAVATLDIERFKKRLKIFQLQPQCAILDGGWPPGQLAQVLSASTPDRYQVGRNPKLIPGMSLREYIVIVGTDKFLAAIDRLEPPEGVGVRWCPGGVHHKGCPLEAVPVHEAVLLETDRRIALAQRNSSTLLYVAWKHLEKYPSGIANVPNTSTETFLHMLSANRGKDDYNANIAEDFFRLNPQAPAIIKTPKERC